MLQKTFVKSLFRIPIKICMIEVLLVKTFWLKTQLQEVVPNYGVKDIMIIIFIYSTYLSLDSNFKDMFETNFK